MLFVYKLKQTSGGILRLRVRISPGCTVRQLAEWVDRWLRTEGGRPKDRAAADLLALLSSAAVAPYGTAEQPWIHRWEPDGGECDKNTALMPLYPYEGCQLETS